jgi:hypothetical protein
MLQFCSVCGYVVQEYDCHRPRSFYAQQDQGFNAWDFSLISTNEIYLEVVGVHRILSTVDVR